MLEISILEINQELKLSDFGLLLPYITKEKQAHINKLRSYRDARNCLLGDILARIKICHNTKIKNDQLYFRINEYGKPYVAPGFNIHFNISHAGNYVACAVSDEPVGIDIELFKSVDIGVAERFFTSDEIAYIKKGKAATIELRLHEIWVKKESRIKWEGRGLYMSLTSFNVLQQDGISLPNYYEVLSNEEAICYVCTCKKSNPIVKIIDIAGVVSITQQRLALCI